MRVAQIERWLKSPTVVILAGVSVIALVTMVRPMLGLIVCVGAAACVAVLLSPLARLGAFVLGGLVVLGSSTDLSTSKVAYAGLLVLVCTVSFANLLRDPPEWFGLVRGWLTLGVALVGSMVVSTVAAPGSDPTSILRQGLFYLLIPIAPMIGIETGRHLTALTTARFAAFCATLSAIGFGVDWLTRRGVASFNLPYLVLGSTVLAGLGFALAVIMASSAKGAHRIGWGLIAFVIPTAMLVTGTRSNLVLFVVILGMLGPAARFRLPAVRAVSITMVVVAALGVLLPFAARYLLSDPTFLDRRVFAALQVLSGDAAGDQSYMYRSMQYAYALQQIDARPWLGFGLGWNPPIVMDTPLLTVIKIGSLGTALLIAYLVSSMLVVSRMGKIYGYTPMHTAASGVGLMVLALIPFGSPLEDRGFCFALALIFAGVAAAARTSPHGLAQGVDPLGHSEPAYVAEQTGEQHQFGYEEGQPDTRGTEQMHQRQQQ